MFNFKKQVRYKRKKRFNPHYEIYVIAIILIIATLVFTAFTVNKIKDDYIDCIVSNEIYKNEQIEYMNQRLENYQKQIELLQISKEAHDKVDMSPTKNDDSKSNNIKSVASISTNAPIGHSFKSYTYYTALSNNSLQGKLQQSAYTDENGLRKVDDYYCVALGSYYGTTIGNKYMVTLSTGVQIKVILCDVKADRHTDANNQYTLHNGCMIEFYVDMTKLNNVARRSGNISSIAGFDGDVVSIVKE